MGSVENLKINCIVIAGGRPAENDPLYAYTKGKPKALLTLGGITMLEHVLNALLESTFIKDIVVVGINELDDLPDHKSIHYLPDQGSLTANGIAGMAWVRERDDRSENVLACSSDIPTLTGEIIDAHIEICHPLERAIYYAVVTKNTMEARFPSAKRTYVKLKGLQVAGGDLLIVKNDIDQNNSGLLEKASTSRKHAWKLARLIGPRILLKYLLRRLSLSEAKSNFEKISGRSVEVIISEHAEIAMDVDKPHQLELLRKEYELRPRSR